MQTIFRYRVTIFVLMLFLSQRFLFPTENGAGIDEKLGKKIETEVVLFNEKGEKISLNSILTKPTIFLFVYYNCPGVCNPLMAEVAGLIDKIDLIPGKEYQLVSVSIDETEDFRVAASKKVNYFNAIKKRIPDSAWHFLTSDKENIKKITESVGFRFFRDRDQIIHPGALVFVNTDGLITRYLPGTTFLPFDIKMAVIETSQGKVTPTVAKLLKFCYKYDPDGRQYVLNITQIAGAVTLLLAVLFIVYFIIKPKKTK